jgi:hypothetical protein
MASDMAILCDLRNALVEPFWAASMDPEDRHLGEFLVDPVCVGQGNLTFSVIGYQSFPMQMSSFTVPYTT